MTASHPDALWLLVFALATYRTTDWLVDDVLPWEPVREWVWRRWPFSDNDPGDSSPAAHGRSEIVPWVRRLKVRLLAPLAGLMKAQWRADIESADLTRPGRTLIGYWWTCPFCASVEIGGAWALAWWQWPEGTRRVMGFVAALGVVSFLVKVGD